jgi:hypothetical protein
MAQPHAPGESATTGLSRLLGASLFMLALMAVLAVGLLRSVGS